MINLEKDALNLINKSELKCAKKFNEIEEIFKKIK